MTVGEIRESDLLVIKTALQIVERLLRQTSLSQLTRDDLLAWRKAHGLSQEEAAKQLGVSRSFLNQVELYRRPLGRTITRALRQLGSEAAK